nr:MAG TPA: hypothetical protein [Caudoviricetes sp.]
MLSLICQKNPQQSSNYLLFNYYIHKIKKNQ